MWSDGSTDDLLEGVVMARAGWAVVEHSAKSSLRITERDMASAAAAPGRMEGRHAGRRRRPRSRSGQRAQTRPEVGSDVRGRLSRC